MEVIELETRWTDRLGGNCFFLLLIPPIGSKSLTCSSDGPAIRKEDSGSTSSENSAMLLYVEALRRGHRH